MVKLYIPQALDFWFEQFNVNYRLDRPTARVVSKQFVSDETLYLQLKPSQLFTGFKAGQHLRLKTTIDGIAIERCYSIANSPNSTGLIHLYIQIQGQVSEYLANKINVNKVVEISAAFGENSHSTYDTFIAGGVGITAIWPLFVEQMKQSVQNNSKLIYLVRDVSDSVLLSEIESSTWYQKGHVLIKNGRSFIESEQLLESLNHAQRIICCGSAGFTEQISQTVNKVNESTAQKKSLITETFNTVHSSKNNNKFTEYKIHLAKQKQTVTVGNDISLLDSLLNLGIAAEHGCKQGICHQCTCKLTGNSAINVDSKMIQICTTFPDNDMEIEL